MRHSSIDWIKISEALDHAYEFLVQQSAEDEHLKQIEAAKKCGSRHLRTAYLVL